MSSKLSIVAAVALIAAPLAAQAVSPGHDMLARVTGVDPHAYTLNEVAQIDGERTPAAAAGRAEFIASQKQAEARSGGSALQFLGGANQGFTANEIAQIEDEDSAADRRDRARFILEQKQAGANDAAGSEIVARQLGVEGLGFTAHELAQIYGEKSEADRETRARFILEQKTDS